MKNGKYSTKKKKLFFNFMLYFVGIVHANIISDKPIFRMTVSKKMPNNITFVETDKKHTFTHSPLYIAFPNQAF